MKNFRCYFNKFSCLFYHHIKMKDCRSRLIIICCVFVFAALIPASLIFSSYYKNNPSIENSSLAGTDSQYSSRSDSSIPSSSEGSASKNNAIPVWYAPGELDLNALYDSMSFTEKPLNAPSADYVYIRAAADLPFTTDEHKNCAYFRIETNTGRVECVDHILRAVLIPKGLMADTDKLFFKEIPSGNHFVLFDIRNSDEVYKSSFRFDLQTNAALKLAINLSILEEYYPFEDFSKLVTTKVSSKWNILLADLDTGKKTTIPTEKEATWALNLSPGNQYVWYSLKRNGNKYTRCIYNIVTGEKSLIQSFSYLFFTPDDRFVLYFAEEGIRRLDMKTREDIVLLHLSGVIPSAFIDIVAYSEQAGKIILSDFVEDNYYNLYSVDVHTGDAVEFMNPSKAGSDVVLKADELMMDHSIAAALSLSSSTSGSASSSTSGSAFSSGSGSTSSPGNGSTAFSNFGSSEGKIPDSNNEAVKPTPSITGLPQPEKETPKGARVYIFDKTHRYIYYYTDLNGNNQSVYCYDIATGNRIAIPLSPEFMNQISTESTDLLFPKQTFGLGYRLYLSDDAVHLYLFLDTFRDKSNVIPLSNLKDYAANNNTIIHFGKMYPNQKYDDFLSGRSYTIYTDNGKVAVLNENYKTKKFILVLFDKPFDFGRPYGGGTVLVEKDLPLDASFGLADWWESANYNRPGVNGANTYDINAVLDFTKTHDSLDGFTLLFPRYSIGSNFAYADLPETGFFYQICVGPNDYVNVTEDYLLMKLQVVRAQTGVTLFERDLKAGLKNSSRLPK